MIQLKTVWVAMHACTIHSARVNLILKINQLSFFSEDKKRTKNFIFARFESFPIYGSGAILAREKQSATTESQSERGFMRRTVELFEKLDRLGLENV